jgi:uncharacterized protein DUF4926
MKYSMLDCVALVEDLPEFELEAGDIGTIVEVYSPTMFDVEFSAPGGYLAALLTIGSAWFRPAKDGDFARERELAPSEHIGTVSRPPVHASGTNER